jgi:tetratricopeptide (TPR) repeat protein
MTRDPEPGGNELSGIVQGPAVQARSISGGVHFGVTRDAPARLPSPAQLPLAPAHFTNREAELALLDRVAAEPDPARRLAVMVISGTGGTGKTALATYWLDRLGDRAGAADVLYADLRGHRPDTATRPGEVLTGFLSALGTRPEDIALDLAEQVKLFRSLTSGRRVLLLLDNAASAAQVRALLPGPGPRDQPGLPSLVVVTTRWRITGLALEGGRFVELASLDDIASIALFGRMIGADRIEAETEAARTVVRLCGGLPLAVCVAGAQLAAHAHWPIGRIAADLASERDRLAILAIAGDISVHAAFEASYQALPARTARLYRLLSRIPGPDFGPDVAAATAGIDLGEAARLLRDLTEASLLEETAGQRFRLHDLVRLHAREQAGDDESARALTGAVGWYLTQAVTADVVIGPGRWHLNPMYEQARASPPAYAGPLAALAWLESELPGLLAATRAAHDEGLHEQTWQLCEAMWGLFCFRKYFRHWIDAHLLGLASAQACHDTRAEGRMHIQLGLAYLNLGQADQARAQFTAALTLARGDQHAMGEGTALEHLGLTDLTQGRTDTAIDAFTQARDVFERIGVARGVLGLTRHIGDAHREAGRPGQAIKHLLEARRLAVTLPDPYNEARCLTGLGRAYLDTGQPGKAERSLAGALAIMTHLGGRYEQARIRASLATALLQLGQDAQAREHLTEALAIYAEIDAPEAAGIRRRLEGT